MAEWAQLSDEPAQCDRDCNREDRGLSQLRSKLESLGRWKLFSR